MTRSKVGQGQGPNVAKMAGFIVYILCQYACNQKTIYSSLFSITWPSNLGCSTFGKRLLPVTGSRPVVPHGVIFEHFWHSKCRRLCFRNGGTARRQGSAADCPRTGAQASGFDREQVISLLSKCLKFHFVQLQSLLCCGACRFNGKQFDFMQFTLINRLFNSVPAFDESGTCVLIFGWL